MGSDTTVESDVFGFSASSQSSFSFSEAEQLSRRPPCPPQAGVGQGRPVHLPLDAVPQRPAVRTEERARDGGHGGETTNVAAKKKVNKKIQETQG